MTDVEDRLRDALPKLARLGAVVRFDLGADGAWLVDARGSSPILDEDSGADTDAACSIKITAENLVKLMEGRMDPMLGYTLGKIKVSGSMGVAMKLVSAIG